MEGGGGGEVGGETDGVEGGGEREGDERERVRSYVIWIKP